MFSVSMSKIIKQITLVMDISKEITDDTQRLALQSDKTGRGKQCLGGTSNSEEIEKTGVKETDTCSDMATTKSSRQTKRNLQGV